MAALVKMCDKCTNMGYKRASGEHLCHRCWQRERRIQLKAVVKK